MRARTPRSARRMDLVGAHSNTSQIAAARDRGEHAPSPVARRARRRAQGPAPRRKPRRSTRRLPRTTLKLAPTPSRRFRSWAGSIVSQRYPGWPLGDTLSSVAWLGAESSNIAGAGRRPPSRPGLHLARSRGLSRSCWNLAHQATCATSANEDPPHAYSGSFWAQSDPEYASLAAERGSATDIDDRSSNEAGAVRGWPQGSRGYA
jgi:hypothetical protein